MRLVLLVVAAAFGLLAAGGATPAFAKHHKHASGLHQPHRKPKPEPPTTAAMIHDAQTSLIKLGYLEGTPDGILGPKTRKAVKKFQKDHGLRVTGTLTKKTREAIAKADSEHNVAALPLAVAPPQQAGEVMSEAHPEFYGRTDQNYADPLIGGPTVAGNVTEAQYARTQGILSRYAKLDVNENTNGPMRRYIITQSGEPIFGSEHQPSIIGMSQTFNLKNEDVIILSTYREDDIVCPYKHFLLTLSDGKRVILPINDNCTRGYQARIVEDSLFITFPELDDQRVAGNTWRYEFGELNRL
jgi:hypothetical protein